MRREGDTLVMYRPHVAMIEVVSPPKRGVYIWGWQGSNPPEERGPIGPGIWVMCGEGDTPVMYRPHVAMIEVVSLPKEGIKIWGRQGSNPPGERGPIGPGIWVMRGEGGTPVMYRPHEAMIEVVSPPKEGIFLWDRQGPIRTG